MTKLTFLTLLLLSIGCDAFFNTKPAIGKAKVNPELITEAVAVYQTRYPPTGKPNTLADKDPKILATTFTEMARIYGPDDSLTMVQTSPLIMAARSQDFAATFAAFGETFGEDETLAMVKRNPNLLFVPPTGVGGADSANDLTMQLSYVVAFTKPAGPFLLGGLALLLALPGIEASTGINLWAVNN